MGFIRDLFGITLLLSLFIHILSWVIAYVIIKGQGKIEDQMRAEVTQPEYYLLKWESNPRWSRLEKLKTRTIYAILLTGAFMLIVGYIGYINESGGGCYSRFEDNCPAFE